jgi:hypothetical protein
VIKLFESQGYELTILTTEETYRRFIDLFPDNSENFTWDILSTKSKSTYFNSLYHKLRQNKPDLLYINTISNNHLLYAFVLSRLSITRVIMTVHDINCLFQSRPSWKFRSAIIHHGKKQLIRNVNEFNVVASTMIPYLEKQTKKLVHNIPGAVYEKRQVVQDIVSPLRIVIPGSLDKRRRNYQQVFDLAKMADRKKISLELVMLGGYYDDYGKSVYENAERFSSASVTIKVYNTRVVDQLEFDRQMDTAHFVWIPSVIDTQICDDIPEVYGLTKSSGNIFDVIKHAKPFLVPKGLSIPPDLVSSCFSYHSNDELLDFLVIWSLSPDQYAEWQANALVNSLNFTIEKVVEKNPGLFRSTISVK